MVRFEGRESCRKREMPAAIEGRLQQGAGTVCRQDGEGVRLAKERPQKRLVMRQAPSMKIITAMAVPGCFEAAGLQ